MDFQKLYDELDLDSLDHSGAQLIEYLQFQPDTEKTQNWINQIYQQLNVFSQIRSDDLQIGDPVLFKSMTQHILSAIQKIIVDANNGPLTKKRKVLFIASDPLDADPLQVGKEMEQIEEALQSSEERDSFLFYKSAHAQMVEVTDDIGRYKPQIIHFSGHGSKTGIQLVDENGLASELRAEVFGQLLRSFENYQPELIYLNACFSARQAELLRPYTQNMIGFFYEADPALAISFAKVFYKRLGNKHSYKEAYQSTKINFLDQIPTDGDHIMLYETAPN